LALAKVGRRGSLVIPASERRRAGIDEGDRVEVRSEEEGLILVRKIASLEKVRKKMAGRLPQWNELEGKADELVLRETRKERHQPE
jgi:AbrB family looped-hinge helix DNA binding protein